MTFRIAAAFLLTAAFAAAQTTAPSNLAKTAITTQPTASAQAGTNKFPSAAALIDKIKNAGADVAKPPPAPQVAYIDLDRSIVEKPADFSFFADDQSPTLRSLLERLEKARDDKDIKAVLITLGGGGMNLSQSLELRDALDGLRKAGKRTFVYADAYDADSYVLASGASDVCLLGGGEIEMPGVGLQTMFLKGLFDKIGVEADFEQIGEYKGADEAYIHTEPSPELRGELNKLVDALYDQLVTSVAKNRHLSPDAVRKIVDQALIPAADAQKDGLVDHLVDVDGLRDLMGEALGGKVDLVHDYGVEARESVDFSNPFNLLAMFSKRPAESDRQAVGLIYAEGVIVDGSTETSLFSQSDQIGSDDLRKAFRIAEKDDRIGAIVLRIDSPGGSALASEAMWQAVRRAEKVKPVIVSVGSMAASGGYYLASAGKYIVADPTAIVGSIGVVGGKFVLKDLFGKVGLGTATFQRGANASLFDETTSWSPQQRQMIHAWMKQTYDQFTQRVMTTRTGKIKDIDKVARGRIFLAEQAKDLGMVDRIGGVNDAIALAAHEAGMPVGSYDVRVLPAPKTLADIFNDGADTKAPLLGSTQAPEGDLLLNALPASDRALLAQQLAVVRLFQAHPIALVCPYRVISR